MLLDASLKFYSSEYDLNCAETILYAANEEYEMNLDKNVFKAMAGFGGGMAVEGVCGAISGAIAVIGILFTKERAHESDRVKNITKEFIEKFTEKLGSNNCLILKERYRNDNIRCLMMIKTAAEILDEIVNREIKK